MKLTLENIIEKIKTSKSVSPIIKSLNKREELKNFIITKTAFLSDESNLKQRLYHIKNDLYLIEKCDICGKNNKEWNNKISCYKDFCSNKDCKYKHNFENRNQEEINKKIKKTKIKKYGENYAIDLYEKSKITCLEKYGANHYTKTEEYKQKMMDKFGYISPFELKETHDKSKETLLNRYGVDHNFKISGMTQKIQNTFILKYGYDNPLKNKIIKDKMIQNNIKKFGFPCPLQNDIIRDKSNEKLMINYGVESPLQSSIILERFKNTNLNKYGETHWMKNSEFYENYTNIKKKSSYKIYIFNDEEIIMQGYEDYVFEELLKCYDRNDIVISIKNINEHVGIIKYYLNDIEHRYYPDIFIKSENLIIEVKSTYTYLLDLEKNLEKEKYCKKLGFNFQFVIIDGKYYDKWKRKKKQ